MLSEGLYGLHRMRNRRDHGIIATEQFACIRIGDLDFKPQTIALSKVAAVDDCARSNLIG